MIFFSFAENGGESEICVVQSISVGESSFFLLYIVLAASSFRCSKSFWDLPLSECTLWQVNPKAGQKVVVLGFAPSRRLSRAYQSQNDFEQWFWHYSSDAWLAPCELKSKLIRKLCELLPECSTALEKESSPRRQGQCRQLR